jgi:hypothetical protein
MCAVYVRAVCDALNTIARDEPRLRRARADPRIFAERELEPSHTSETWRA